MAIFRTIIALILLAVPAWAEDMCFTPRQVAAEQLLRLHSELMVIGISCRQTSQGQQLMPLYGKFSQRFANSLRDAEAELISYYESKGKDGPGSIDKLRTEMANDFAQHVANDTPKIYCRQQQTRLLQVSQWSASRVRQELAQLASRFGTIEPSCEPIRTARGPMNSAGGANSFPVRRN